MRLCGLHESNLGLERLPPEADGDRAAVHLHRHIYLVYTYYFLHTNSSQSKVTRCNGLVYHNYLGSSHDRFTHGQQN